MRRRFNRKQKMALYRLSNGKCAVCGCDLDGTDWHADHVVPFSHGGQTDVLNGQALCALCNLSKGSHMLPPFQIDLREWQSRAFGYYINHASPSFLAGVSPGGGKTIFALKCAHYLLDVGIIDFVIVVVPNVNLRKQWKNAAAKAGIMLNHEFANSHVNWNGTPLYGEDMHGIVVTYAQVANNAEMYRAMCSRKVLLIADEIHHVGDERAWGVGFKHAFERTVRQLLLSGTPFREDNCRIPFVHYDANGVSRADFTWGYGDGLVDGVLRSVYFPHYESTTTVRSLDPNNVRTFRFADTLSEIEANRRLRNTVGDTGESSWLAGVFREADSSLRELREEDPKAGGIVFCLNATHARDAATLLKKITGATPEVVKSEDEDSHDRIDAFARGSQPWIVSIKMVSEGVDIPRLRVAVYADCVTAELTFRQRLGRILRGPASEAALFYIPADTRLLSHADQCKSERNHEIDEDGNLRTNNSPRDFSQCEQPQIEIVETTAEANGVIHDDARIERNCVDIAEKMKVRHGLKQPTPLIAEILHIAMRDGIVTPQEPPQSQSHEVIPEQDVKKKLRDEVNRLVTILHHKTGKSYGAINTTVQDMTDYLPIRGCSTEGLKKRITLLNKWIKGYDLGECPL